jgi:hypothetical protein
MTDIYKESLIEAKKIREVVEADAKRKIVEQISPIIKRMITKEVASSFFFEEDDLPPPEGEDPTGLGSVIDAAPPETAMPPMGDVGVVPPPMDAGAGALPPVSPVGDGAGIGSDIMDIGLPDKDGMYVVDINKLWATGTPEDPTAAMAGAVIPEPSPGAGALGPVDTMPVAPGAPAADLGAGALPPPEDTTGAAMLPPAAPAGVPAVPGLPPEEEEIPPPPPVVAENYNEFKARLHEVAMRIDEAFFSNKMPYVVSEGLKQKLFGLLERLDALIERGVISPKQGKLNENRLEFLFVKLKEAKLATSYNQKGNPNMKSLKEFAAKLYENEDQERLAQDSASSGNTGVPVHKSATAKAQSVDGVQADLFEDSTLTQDEPSGEGVLAGKKALPGTTDTKNEPWNEADAIAEGKEGFGDTGEKPVASPEELFEVDEKELREAIRELRLEMASRGRKGKKPIKEEAETLKGGKPKTGDQGSVKPVGGKAPAQKVLEPNLKEDTLSLNLPDVDLSDVDVDNVEIDIESMLAGMDSEMGGEEDLDSLDGEGEEEMMDMGGEGEEEVLDLDAEEEGGDDEGGDDEGGLALGGGEEDMEAGPEDLGAGEEEGDERVVLHDDELDEMGMMMEARRRRRVAKALLEAARAKRVSGKKPAVPSKKVVNKPVVDKKAVAYRQIAEVRTREVTTLKKEMAETNLFLSKVLLLNKFLQRGDLNRKQQQAIVEHLDRAKTIAEAKTVYEKIKTKLSESATAKKSATSAKVVGSASKPVAPASAEVDTDKMLTESVLSEGIEADKVIIGDADRWAVLVKGGRD